MNKLLLLNKNLFIFFSLSVLFFVILFFTFKYYMIADDIYEELNISDLEVDIINPKFSISGSNQYISITAKEGHFVNDDEILLKNEVIFKSDNFKILSDNVFFDKKNLTAYSKKSSKFISSKTIISSSGFNIEENGNKINFNGKSKIIIK